MSYSGAYLFDLLGASIVDDRVTALLTQLGAVVPPVHEARETDIRAREHGLDIRFKPVGFLREGIAPGASPDEVLLSVLFFHGQGHEKYPEFSGELPFGLRFDMSRAEVEAI